ncbi:alpha/beta-hydrolase [Hypoxylon sp. NC1633]|nr:alpha/beta-hydrolase [Hypoxylon sp. NC1633]
MRVELNAKALLATSILIPFSQATPINASYSMDWKPCPVALAPGNSTLRCGYLSVPLDWDTPENGYVTIGVAKLPARNQSNRIGNIFFQPGGPGNQGSLSVAQMETGELEVGAEILDRFDMIGVDVRGTGLSNPVKCDVELYNARLPFYPSDPESFEKRVQHNLALRQSCLDMSGNDLIDYMDSISIAKDYEAVRIALGGEPMNWLGVSYGTQLGSQYAELFPGNIRSMALDGVVSQSQAQISQFLAGAVGLDATFRRFAKWCERQNVTACPAVQDAKNRSVEEIWADIVTQAERRPLPCKDPKCLRPDMTADEIRLGASQYLYTVEPNWGYLGEAIYNATIQNDASPFTSLYPQVSPSASAYDNSPKFGGLAIVCQDWAHHDNTSQDLKVKQVLAGSEAPLLNGLAPAHLFQLSCIGWPGNDRNPPHAISIPRTKKMPKILIVNAIYDPATPLTWAMQLREEIGEDRVVMIVRNGGGHPTYDQPGTAGGTTKTAMERYILNLTLPEDGAIFDS